VRRGGGGAAGAQEPHQLIYFRHKGFPLYIYLHTKYKQLEDETMKKWISLLLALAMMLSIAACGSNNSTNNGAANNSTENTAGNDTADNTTNDTADDTQDTGSELSATVQQLYAEFDAAMEEQIGPMPESFGDIKVGAVVISLTNQFWVNMKDFYEAAGEELGIPIDVQTGTTEGDTASQLDVLMTMADMDYDVIIVSPIDGTNLIPGIVKCNENGVKVINLGPGVDTEALAEAGGHLDATITVAFTEQGETVANDMISRLPDGGQVAIIAGLAGAGQSEGRTSGAKEVFEATEGIELVAVQNCDWDATLAYDATKALITEYPDLKGIFCCNDTMALAAVEALAAEGKEDVLVYGVDFTDDARAAIMEGTMTGSMSYSSQRYTKAALQMAVMLNEGETFDSSIYLPLTLVTVDNVNDLEGWQ